MTPERLAEIKAELQRAEADTDYYVGGLAPAGLGLELLAEVERLQAELTFEQKPDWMKEDAHADARYAANAAGCPHGFSNADYCKQCHPES